MQALSARHSTHRLFATSQIGAPPIGLQPLVVVPQGIRPASERPASGPLSPVMELPPVPRPAPAAPPEAVTRPPEPPIPPVLVPAPPVPAPPWADPPAPPVPRSDLVEPPQDNKNKGNSKIPRDLVMTIISKMGTVSYSAPPIRRERPEPSSRRAPFRPPETPWPPALDLPAHDTYGQFWLLGLKSEQGSRGSSDHVQTSR